MGVVTKHKALFLKEYGKPLVAEEVPTPKPKGEEVLLKTIGAGNVTLTFTYGRGRQVRLFNYL